MKYFAASTAWDFPITAFDPEASILLSPTTFAPTHRYRGPAPQALIVDSGAYHHGQRNAQRSRLRSLADQLQIASQFPHSEVTIAHCDLMIRDPVSAPASIDSTLRNAEWFMAQGFETRLRRMTIAQARSPDEMYLVVTQLAEFAPAIIGLGGLANLHRVHRNRLGPMIEAAVEAAGSIAVHALGVTAAYILQRLQLNGVGSCDSATAARNSVYGSVIYAHPLRKYRFISEKSSRPETPQSTGYYTTIRTPPPCVCPVCRDNPLHLTGTTTLSKHARYIHNYYQLKLEIEGGGSWQAAYSLAEYPSVMRTWHSFTDSSPSKGL